MKNQIYKFKNLDRKNMINDNNKKLVKDIKINLKNSKKKYLFHMKQILLIYLILEQQVKQL